MKQNAWGIFLMVAYFFLFSEVQSEYLTLDKLFRGEEWWKKSKKILPFGLMK